jgi:hypothetical protein
LLAITKDQDVYTCAHKASKLDSTDSTSSQVKNRAEILAEWAEKKIGLTAKVKDGFETRNIEESQPTTVRFMDLQHDPLSAEEDIENLKKSVQLHNCSGFCMRPGKGKE